MRTLLVNPAHPQTFWSFDKVMKMTGKKALAPASWAPYPGFSPAK